MQTDPNRDWSQQAILLLRLNLSDSARRDQFGFFVKFRYAEFPEGKFV